MQGSASNNEREVRLVRVVEQLRRRLDQLRGENEQLEEELRNADSKLTGGVPVHGLIALPGHP